MMHWKQQWMLLKEGHIQLRRANRAWNIPLNSLFDHLNGKTRFKKMGLGGVLTIEKDAKVIKWTLSSKNANYP
jgi:hypothetical protein